jgi:hypothetical protein
VLVILENLLKSIPERIRLTDLSDLLSRFTEHQSFDMKSGGMVNADMEQDGHVKDDLQKSGMKAISHFSGKNDS